MEYDSKLSCDAFTIDTSTSSKSGVDFHCPERRKEKPPAEDTSPVCSQMVSSTSTTSSSISVGFFNQACAQHRGLPGAIPNIGYELAFAKSVMQQYSSLSGDNL